MTSSNLSSAAFSTPLVEDSSQRRIKPKIIAPKLGNRLGILPDTPACRHERSRRCQYISKNWIYPADTVFHQPRAVLQAGSCSPRRPPGGTVEHEPRSRVRPSFARRRPEVCAGRLASGASWEFETYIDALRQLRRPPAHPSSAAHGATGAINPYHERAVTSHPRAECHGHIQRATPYADVVNENDAGRSPYANPTRTFLAVISSHQQGKHRYQKKYQKESYPQIDLFNRSHARRPLSPARRRWSA